MQSESHDGAESGAGDGGVVKRACDQCRSRKIRCDKESPCSNCRIAQRSCSSLGLGQKPREPRQRVLISSQYEKKIDYFGNRLAGIEDLLRELTISLKSRPAGASSSSGTAVPSIPQHIGGQRSGSDSRTTPSSGAGARPYTAFVDGDDTDASSDLGDSAFEGQSSTRAHTAQASAFLEQVVERDRWSNRHISPNMQAALSNLQRIVGLQQQRKKAGRMGSMPKRDVKFPNQKPIPPGGLRDLPMPPAQVIVQLLREIKDKPPLTFTLICAFITVEDFTESCRKIYFPTEDFSICIFIIVNTGLYYLFQEKFIIMDENSGMAAEYLAYDHMCRDNVETALANMPFFLPPKMETIEALLLGVCYSIELSKMSVAWQLNSTAATLCVTLGYHRLSSWQTSKDQPDSQPPPAADPVAEKKQTLFWFAFMLDKSLALRFGRPSILQDYDIALPTSEPGATNVHGTLAASGEWSEVFELWIRHAEIQGQTYQHLYSSTALQRRVEERVESARTLEAKVTALARRTAELHAALAAEQRRKGEDDAVARMTVDMVLTSDQVQHYSTLALIYRAIPPSEPARPTRFNERCVAVSRTAFALHQECMEITASSQFMNTTYIHWTIMSVPFVPFIVIFCYVIETSSKDDLKLLEQFTNSLRISGAVSGAVDKLYRLCRIMCDVAMLYVEAKQAETQAADVDMAPLGNDFDMYLSQLGFMPPVQAEFDAAGGGGLSSAAMDGDMMSAPYQAEQLNDWFEGGRHMMGLVEEDLSQFQPQPGVWSIYGQRQHSLISKPP